MQICSCGAAFSCECLILLFCVESNVCFHVESRLCVEEGKGMGKGKESCH